MTEAPPQPPAPGVEEGHASLLGRLKSAWHLAFSNLRWRILVCTLLARLLPDGRAAGLRTRLVRAIGVDIGQGTRFLGMPMIQSAEPGPLRPRLRIGRDCIIGTRV